MILALDPSAAQSGSSGTASAGHSPQELLIIGAGNGTGKSFLSSNISKADWPFNAGDDIQRKSGKDALRRIVTSCEYIEDEWWVNYDRLVLYKDSWILGIHDHLRSHHLELSTKGTNQ